MAKSIDLFFILFGSIVFLYPRNDGVYVATDREKREELQQVFQQEIGVREKTNNNDGERVAEYLGYTNLPEGYAWCASFVSWCFGQAGFREPKTAWSPSLFPAKRIVWRGGVNVSGKKGHKPQVGDVFGIYFSNLKRIGHAGFVDEWGDKYVITTEGNTNEAGGRDGDGVYRKRRPLSSIYAVADWITPHY